MNTSRIHSLLAAQKIITAARLAVVKDFGCENPMWKMLQHAGLYLNDELKREFAPQEVA